MKEIKSIAFEAGPASPGVLYIHIMEKLPTPACYIW